MSKQEASNQYQKLPFISVVFIFFETVKKFLVPLLVGLLSSRSADRWEWAFNGLMALLSLGSVVSYWFYRYRLDEDKIIIKQGILFKSVRQIPYRRIQNLNVEQNILHRLFKVAVLQLESASGSKPEAVMRVLNSEQLAAVQQAVQGVSNGEQAQSDAVEPSQELEEPVLLALNKAEVSRYGLIHLTAFLPLAGLLGLAFQNDAFMHWVVVRISLLWIEFKFDIDNGIYAWYADWLLYLLFAILAVTLVIVFSILLAHLRLHNFRLTKSDGKLRAGMGLLTKISANIPLHRIQLLRFYCSPLHRLFKRYTIKMETAGGVTAQTGIVMSWLAPLIRQNQVAALVKEVDSNINFEQLEWQSLSAKAQRRLLKKSLLIFGLLCLPGIYFLQDKMWWSLLLLPLLLVYVKRWLKYTAFAHNEELIAYRSGAFFRKMSLVKISKIQTIRLLETPFDRRLNMGSIQVDTAGSNIAAHRVDIPYLDKNIILQLHHKLTEQVSREQFVW